MPSLLPQLIIDYPSLFHRDHIISRKRIALRRTLIVCIIVYTNQCTYIQKDMPAAFFFPLLFIMTARRQLSNGQIRRNNERGKGFGTSRGYIDSWGGWISDPRSVSGRWRCFTIEDNAQKTIRQFQDAFPRGINRPSFKPSALLVLPFLNPCRHHPVAAGASPLHVHVTYRGMG